MGTSTTDATDTATMNNATKQRARVVVGVDGSDASSAALLFAAREARARNGVLEVVSVWHYPAFSDSMGGVYPMPSMLAEIGRSEEIKLSEQVDTVLGSGPDLSVQQHSVCGSAASELLARAVGADLLVVGSSGHGAFLSAVLGSTAHKCVNHAPCPIAVVPVSRHR